MKLSGRRENERINVIRNNVFEIGEWVTADSAFLSLLSDLPLKQLLHFCWRSEFSITPRMMGIFNALDWCPGSAPGCYLLRPQQKSELWMGHRSFRRSFMGFLGWVTSDSGEYLELARDKLS